MPTVNLTVTNDAVATMASIYPSQYAGNYNPAVGHSGSPYVDVWGNGYYYYYDFHVVLPSNATITNITITCGIRNRYTNGVNNPLRYWDKNTGSVSSNTSFSSGQTGSITWSPTGNFTSGATRSFRLEMYSSNAYGVNEVTSITVSCTYTPSGIVKVNVGGTWKSATPWVNVGGTWKQAIPWVNVGGTWKISSG